MHEDRRVAAQAQAQRGLVVLGDRAAGKDFEFAIADGGQRFAPERAADAGARHETPHRLAHHHIFEVVLGELIDVRPRRPLIPRALERQHRQLHHVEARHQVVVDPQRERVDHVFDVVQDDDRIGIAGFLTMHRREHLVEILRLGGGAGQLVDHRMNARRPFGGGLHFAHGLFIVRIDADEDIVVVVVERRAGELEHRPEDPGFVPARDHDRNTLLRLLAQLLDREPRIFAQHADRPAPRGAQPECNVAAQIVEAEDDVDRSDDDRRDAEDVCSRERYSRGVQGRWCDATVTARTTTTENAQRIIVIELWIGSINSWLTHPSCSHARKTSESSQR